MRVLVTGGTGFIGGALARRLKSAGHKVRIFTLPNDPALQTLDTSAFEIYKGDISNAAQVAEAVKGCALVFHCAGLVSDWGPRELFWKVNVQGTRNVAEACVTHKVKRLIYISTNDVFGLREDTVMDESFPLAKWGEPYADSKIEAEQAVWEVHKRTGLEATMVFPCWVYGPGDKTFVPLIADAIQSHSMVFWRKDVVVWPSYVDNVVDLLVLISKHKAAVGNGYIVHDGESTTFQEFCGVIADTLALKRPKLTIPYFLANAVAVLLTGIWKLLGIKTRPLLTTYTVKNLGSRLKFSIAKSQKQLGWKPAVNYKDGMQRTMAWLKTMDRKALKMK